MTDTPAPPAPAARALSLPEFIALTAMLVATVALSLDGLLPAIPSIAAELTPEAPNRAGIVVTSFFFGLGIGTLFTGPLSDSYGRKAVIVGGMSLFVAATLVAWSTTSYETMVAARVVMGLGASAARVTAMAMVRDLYAGRRMAQVVSFVLMIFVLVPAVAPLLGAAIMAAFGWRQIFLAFILFTTAVGAWLMIRQPETLPPDLRRPFTLPALAAGVREVVGTPLVRLVMISQTMAFGILFGSIVVIQPIFDVTFGRAASFPWWFAGIALVAGTGNLLNALLVQRLGMITLITAAFSSQILFAGIVVLGTALDLFPEAALFPVFVAWMISVFFIAALTIGNLNALAMEPMGHIAGMTSSVVAAVSTVGAAVITIPVSLAFDGTPLSLALNVFFCALLGWALMRRIRVIATD